VGGRSRVSVDVRVIAASNRDPAAEIAAGRFREDLYYRLNVVRIKMPPLRERGEDIPQIVDFCLQNLVKQKKARVTKVSPEAMAVLVRHRWPGNVRELENVVYRSAVIAQGDAILVKDLPVEIRDAVGVLPPAESRAEPAAAVEPIPVPAEMPKSPAAAAPALTLNRALDFAFGELSTSDEPIMTRLEREFISRALAAEDGDETKAAKRLGLTKTALQKSLRELKAER
jgi:DNA-binding NtrC family response regulator